MGRTPRLTVMVGALALAGPLSAQGPGIALLPFENSGSYGQDKEVFQALELGIPATLESVLGRHPGVRVADRGQVRQAMSRQNAGPAQRLDAATAAAIAKAVGARYAVTGSFADFYGKFRINARVVNTETGEIVKVVSNDDPALQDRAQLSAIIQAVGDKILAAIGVTQAGGASQPVPTEALNQFSLGLLFESRADATRAAEAFQRALGIFPGYEDARSGLGRVQGK